MISLRRHLDQWDDLHGRARTALEAYIHALTSLNTAARDMAGGEGVQCRHELEAVLEFLNPEAATAEIVRSREGVERGIAALAEAVNRRDGDYRQIIRIMAEAGATMVQSSSAYGKELRQIAAKVEAVTQLDSIQEVRRRLNEHATELRTVAERVQREGEARARRLEEELQTARESLKSASTLAETDPLTGLGNRRRAENAAQEAMAKGGAVSVLLLDLNGFKAVNDTYGHVQGDSLLKLVAQHVRRCMRESDAVCRWGGDEFVVIMPETNLSEAQGAAARIRNEVFGEFVLGRAGENVRVFISACIGAAEREADESAMQLLERADRLMYEQKVRLSPGAGRPAAATNAAAAGRARAS